jgi:hypothetical protein
MAPAMGPAGGRAMQSMQCNEFRMIEQFFRKRRAGRGGPVSASQLFCPENRALLSIEFIPAVDIANEALSRVKSLARTKYSSNVGTRLIPKVIAACNKREIPQNYIPGMLLLYLEVCENCEWRHLLNGVVEGWRASGDWSEEWVDEVCRSLSGIPGFRYAKKQDKD